MKISCETVLAESFEAHNHSYRDASHPKARSHCPIAALDGLGQLVTGAELHDRRRQRIRNFGVSYGNVSLVPKFTKQGT
jgi:hypothetical protein